jgi:hypothetical protein
MWLTWVFKAKHANMHELVCDDRLKRRQRSDTSGGLSFSIRPLIKVHEIFRIEEQRAEHNGPSLIWPLF